MAFLAALPTTLRTTHTSVAKTPTTPRRTHRASRTPRATIAAPMTPSDPTDNAPAAPWMPLPGVVHALKTPEEYDRLSAVAAENGKLLVIDFMASWCRKCLYLLPRLRKIAGAVPDAYYCSVDVNKVRRLPKQFDITKMPTFVFVRNCERVATIVGGAAPPKVATQVEDTVRRLAKE